MVITGGRFPIGFGIGEKAPGHRLAEESAVADFGCGGGGEILGGITRVSNCESDRHNC